MGGLWNATRGIAGAADQALDVAVRPGESGIFKAMNSALGKIPPGVALALAIGVPLSFLGMRRVQDEGNMLRRFDRAEQQGDLPMSDQTFTSFMQRRKHGAAQLEKTAQGARGILGEGTDAIGALLKKLLYRKENVLPQVSSLAKSQYLPQAANVTKGIDAGLPWEQLPQASRIRARQEAAQTLGAVPGVAPAGAKDWTEQYFKEELDPLKALLAGGAALGGGLALDVMGEPLEKGLQQTVFPGYGQQTRKEKLLEQFASEGGKQTARLLGEMVGGLGTTGMQAVMSIPMSHEQRRIFGYAIKTDPLLNAATANEKRTLERAFNSMTRFAPELATDEFAVKNFLRESLMSSAGGPDYSTLSNLARASQTLQGDSR